MFAITLVGTIYGLDCEILKNFGKALILMKAIFNHLIKLKITKKSTNTLFLS